MGQGYDEANAMQGEFNDFGFCGMISIFFIDSR